MIPVDDLLSDLVGSAARRVLLAGRVDGLARPAGVEVVDLDHPPEPKRSAAVVFVADDAADLRATAFPRLGRTRTVVCLLRGASAALVASELPTWPAVTDQDARYDGDGALTVLRFEGVVAAHEVYAVLAAAAGDASVRGPRGLVIGFVRGQGQPVPPADPSYVEITPETRIADLVVPPDVVLSAEPLALDESPVTGRVPLVLDGRADRFDDEGVVEVGDRLSSYDWRRRLAAAAGLELPGPLPEPVVGSRYALPHGQPAAAAPIGFDPHASDPVRDLSTLEQDLPFGDLVAGLRSAVGVRVDSDGRPELVEQLAAAGVPLVRAGDDVDLADPLAREEHSIVVRRAALDRADPPAGRPPVSILLATRRPEMLDHTLAQVARQRGAQVELVLATHGFEADAGRVREALGDTPFRLLPCPPEMLFGRVLAEASAVASGAVLLKMDDDDWYGPDLVADLLRARGYSGAPVVGTAADFMYLTDQDLTVRQRFPSEKYTNFVAGGTLMIESGLLRAIGGWRPTRKYVDAQVLAAARAVGAAIYRTHGLGYLLRRNPTGHTWTLAADDLIEDTAVSWPGFRPSRLLECDAPGG